MPAIQSTVKAIEITFKDLNHHQLDTLKDIYIDNEFYIEDIIGFFDIIFSVRFPVPGPTSST